MHPPRKSIPPGHHRSVHQTGENCSTKEHLRELSCPRIRYPLGIQLRPANQFDFRQWKSAYIQVLLGCLPHSESPQCVQNNLPPENQWAGGKFQPDNHVHTTHLHRRPSARLGLIYLRDYRHVQLSTRNVNNVGALRAGAFKTTRSARPPGAKFRAIDGS